MSDPYPLQVESLLLLNFPIINTNHFEGNAVDISRCFMLEVKLTQITPFSRCALRTFKIAQSYHHIHVKWLFRGTQVFAVLLLRKMGKIQ